MLDLKFGRTCSYRYGLDTRPRPRDLLLQQLITTASYKSPHSYSSFSYSVSKDVIPFLSYVKMTWSKALYMYAVNVSREDETQ